MRPLRVVAELDGSGVVVSLRQPPHLDGLLAYAHAARSGLLRDLWTDEQPDEIELPLDRRQVDGIPFWAASVLEIAESCSGIQMARRRFDKMRAQDLVDGTVRFDCGIAKETNRPWQTVIATEAVAWCIGDRSEVADLLQSIRWVGAERGRGRGRVVRWRVEPTDEAFAVSRGGLAMRYIPHSRGTRFVRPRPPYWHPHGAVRCIGYGDAV